MTTNLGILRTSVLALILLAVTGVQAQDNSAPKPTPRTFETKVFKAQDSIDYQLSSSPYILTSPDGGDVVYQDTASLYYPAVTAQQHQINNQMRWLAAFRDPADATLGATLEPVGESLRAQLDLPRDRGLVVKTLAGDGPSAQAGLKSNDILLSLADKPLTKLDDDLSIQLKAAGESPVQLQLLRAGKPLTLQVRPIYHVTLGPATEQPPVYYIGVQVSPPDDTLRAHVDIPDGKGLVATDIIAGTPAEKVGLKAHDILLEMGGKPLDSPESLVAQVKATKDQPTTLKVLRKGKTFTVDVTPVPRPAEPSTMRESVHLFWSANRHPQTVQGWTADLLINRGEPNPDDAQRQVLDRLERELKDLHKAIEELRGSIKSAPPKGRD